MKKKVVFCQDKIKGLKFILLPRSPYLPYLMQSDFYLFPNLKKWLTGKRFTDDNQVSDAVNGCFEPVSYTHLDVYKRQVLDRRCHF